MKNASREDWFKRSKALLRERGEAKVLGVGLLNSSIKIRECFLQDQISIIDLNCYMILFHAFFMKGMHFSVKNAHLLNHLKYYA